MKKKIWIRLVGVAALLAWVWDYLVWHSAVTTRPGLDQGYMDLTAIFFACVAGFITAVWALFSIIDWALRRQAKLKGAQLAQGLPGGPPSLRPAIAAPHPAAPQAPALPTCVECRAEFGLWWCNQHGLPLCDKCAGGHRVRHPECTWAVYSTAPAAAANGPRVVVTSPLAGLR